MAAKTVHLIYFSPTGTTRKVVEAIAAGTGVTALREYDLTFPGQVAGGPLAAGLVILGVPVYAGRVPEVCLERLKDFSADGLPTALVALYGNREFEDALVELHDVASAKGFRVLAAAAFIGEHSYATPDYPIAVGRPDADDLDQARAFGAQFAARAEGEGSASFELEGHRPYRERVPLGGIAPETDAALCTLCGRCAEVCPMGIVAVSDHVTTRAERCIMCCACVKECPVAARPFTHARIQERRELLRRNCATPKSPKRFL